MNKVQQSIYENIVHPAIQNIAGLAIGVVEEFDNLMQMGTVSFSKESTGERSSYHFVPMANFGGIKQPNPFPGDKVLLAFLGNNYKRPIILGRIDYNHQFETRLVSESHFRSGGNITDIYSERAGDFTYDS